MKEFLKQLGMTDDMLSALHSSGKSSTIDIPDSETFGQYYTILDTSDLVEEDTESSQITREASSIQFVNDDYTITLLANLEADTYELVVREN